MRSNGVERLRRKRRQTAQQLSRIGSPQRHIFEVSERIDAVLRRLDRDRVGDAVGRAQPIGRGGLRAAGEGRLKAGRGVILGEPDDASEFAVEVDLESGVLESFLNAGIGNSGNMANLRQELVGERAARFDVIAGDLDVDRRRRAEVENLANDVGRKERECHAWEGLRELLAQGLDVSVGRESAPRASL